MKTYKKSYLKKKISYINYTFIRYLMKHIRCIINFIRYIIKCMRYLINFIDIL